MSNFFSNKFNAVKNSYFSLNSFGFKPGGINPFLQSKIYKSFCISKLLYGLEIMFVNKKTIYSMNLQQNNIVRYMTGLSKKCHISDVLIILKLLNIDQLNTYMKLIFVKNLKNNVMCNYIFNYLLNNQLLIKSNSLSFINDIKRICILLNLDINNIQNNIISILNNYKKKIFDYEENLIYDLIKTCLENNYDFCMREQLNFIQYTGKLC
jgi:hypothetical protein